MKKLLLLLILIPLTITAAPVQVQVTEFFWEHDGVDLGSFDMVCDGSIVGSPSLNDRTLTIPALSDGDHDCVVIAKSPEGWNAPPSNAVNFTTSLGIHTMTRLVPGAATGLGVR